MSGWSLRRILRPRTEKPMQPFAKDMDSAMLKREYGDRVCFHGGIDIQYKLPGSLKEMEEVKTRIRQFAPCGGYILSPPTMCRGMRVAVFLCPGLTRRKMGIYSCFYKENPVIIRNIK